MTSRWDRAFIRATLLSFPDVLGVGYGLKEKAGKLTQQRAWRVYVREKKPGRQLRAQHVIPPFLHGLSTDVITHAPALSSASKPGARLRVGAKIANSRG